LLEKGQAGTTDAAAAATPVVDKAGDATTAAK
jgi:hypothetical protein